MPGLLMYDGCDDDLFEHFLAVAQWLGMYAAKDYVDILEFFVERWSVEKLTGLSSEGEKCSGLCLRVSLKIEKAGGESSRKG